MKTIQKRATPPQGVVPFGHLKGGGPHSRHPDRNAWMRPFSKSNPAGRAFVRMGVLA
jgi:hypothetical protein